MCRVIALAGGCGERRCEAERFRGIAVDVASAQRILGAEVDRAAGARAGVPCPSSVHLTGPERAAALKLPCVLKPRFGSWGRDVMLCRTRAEVERCLSRVCERAWFELRVSLVCGSGTEREKASVVTATGVAGP